MDESRNENITEAIQFILNQLKAHGLSPNTLKLYGFSFNVFEKYLKKNSITHVNEEICIEYLYHKTGKKISSFSSTINDKQLNRVMRPLHLLLMYLETGQFKIEIRKQKAEFICPKGFLEEYQHFKEDCKFRGYANATIRSNLGKIQAFLKHLESIDVNNSKKVTLAHIENYLRLYEKHAVKYVGTILYVLRSYFSFLYEKGFITNSTFSPRN